MDATQTAELTTPFHTQGIADKATARTHYLGGRELILHPKSHFEGTTNYQDNYHAHPLPGRLNYEPPAVRESKPFDATSTYSNQFKGHEIAPRSPITPSHRAVSTGVFDGSTTYGGAYVGHEIEQRELAAAPPPRPQSKFEGTTVYHDAFVPHSIEPRAAMTPHSAPRDAGAFDGTTTYGSNFHAHELPSRPQYSAPPPREQARFDATTTNQDVYTAHAMQAREVHGPMHAVKPHVPFDGTTTNQDVYKNHGVLPRAQPAAPPPMKAHVPFDGTTTNRDTFKGWQLPPKFPGIGLEIMGDRMHTLVPAGCDLPFKGTHIFSTVHDNQREICILIYSGNAPSASQNELLGQFDMTGLPPSRARTLQLEVTFEVSKDRMLSVVARDLDSDRQYQWLQNGRMMVKTLSGAIGEVHGMGGAAGNVTIFPGANAGITA